MAKCPTPVRLRPTYEDTSTGETFPGEVIHKACRRWRCEACGPKKLIEARKYIEAGVVEALFQRPDDPVRLLTITFPTDRDLQVVVADDVREANQRTGRFIEDIRRKLGCQFEYFKVIEPTKRGRIHLHMICWGDRLPKCTPRQAHMRGIQGRAANDCYCTPAHPCIQRVAYDHGLGFVDIRAAQKPNEVIWYVTKYLTKSIRQTRWPRYARRISASHRFAPTTLGEIYQTWVEKVIADLTKDGQPEPPQVLYWEFEPPISHPALPPLPTNRAPPQIENMILDPATGLLLPVPF